MIFFYIKNVYFKKVKVLVTQSYPTLWTPWAVACQAPLSMEFSGLGVGGLSLLQGIVPTQGSNSGLLHYRQILYHLSHSIKYINR